MVQNGLEDTVRHHRPKYTRLSKLVPYSGLILTLTCILMFLGVRFVLEPLVRRTKGYKILDHDKRKSFINHYVAAIMKLILIIGSVYPAIAVVAGVKTIQSPYVQGSTVTIGDSLLCTFHVFTAMYIFELFYRNKVSLISSAHHIGAIIITQTAVVLFLDPAHQTDAELEFILCLLWGFFDIVAEFWPHAALIMHRTWPDKHEMLADTFLATAVLELIGTTVETIVIFTLFGYVWSEWTIEFKILSPLLHFLFSIAQLWGVRVFWQMSRHHRALADASLDGEAAVVEHDMLGGSDSKREKVADVSETSLMPTDSKNAGHMV